jgi:hypothetical protein
VLTSGLLLRLLRLLVHHSPPHSRSSAKGRWACNSHFLFLWLPPSRLLLLRLCPPSWHHLLSSPLRRPLLSPALTSRPSLLLEDRRPQPTPHRPSSACCRRTRRAPSPPRRRHGVASHTVDVRYLTSRTPPAVRRPARCARLHLCHDGAICHRLGQ